MFCHSWTIGASQCTYGQWLNVPEVILMTLQLKSHTDDEELCARCLQAEAERNEALAALTTARDAYTEAVAARNGGNKLQLLLYHLCTY